MKARLSPLCVCGRALVRDESAKTLQIMCVNKGCEEYNRRYEPPTVVLVPVHAKGK